MLREDALYASYRRLERPLYNVLYRQLWHAQDCQDLIHDTYLRLWERRARVEEATLDALAWTTALNLARNRLRWRAVRKLLPLEHAADLPEESPGAADVLAEGAVRRALASLPRLSREVLLLSHFADLAGAEIARVLGVPEGTVASRKHHALAHMKTLLGDAFHD